LSVKSVWKTESEKPSSGIKSKSGFRWNKNWYKTWFGNEYLTVYAHRDATEARQLIRLIQTYIPLSADQKILDLCCGQGRHALYLARKGYEVYGIDLSRSLLEYAKFHKIRGQAVYFIQADMRYLPTAGSFDLLLNLFTSFGYFESDEENKTVFRQFNQALKTGGFFVFDYFNATHVIKNLVPYHREELADLVIEQERFIDDSRVHKIITLTRNGKKSVFHESVKIYTPEQLQETLSGAGMQVRYRLGDYEGHHFQEDSPRFLAIGVKTNTDQTTLFR
jgi:SAM-dependent methyltransferase